MRHPDGIYNELRDSDIHPSRGYTYDGPDGTRQHISAAEVMAIEMSGRSGTVQQYAMAPQEYRVGALANSIDVMHDRPGAVEPGVRPRRFAYVPRKYGRSVKTFDELKKGMIHWGVRLPVDKLTHAACDALVKPKDLYGVEKFRAMAQNARACPACVSMFNVNHR